MQSHFFFIFYFRFILNNTIIISFYYLNTNLLIYSVFQYISICKYFLSYSSNIYIVFQLYSINDFNRFSNFCLFILVAKANCFSFFTFIIIFTEHLHRNCHDLPRNCHFKIQTFAMILRTHIMSSEEIVFYLLLLILVDIENNKTSNYFRMLVSII